MHSSGINGEGKLRRQPANLGSPGKMAVKMECVCVVCQVLAMSSRSWLSYTYQSRFHLTPLSYDTLEYASGFASEQCPEGIVAISTNTLRY